VQELKKIRIETDLRKIRGLLRGVYERLVSILHNFINEARKQFVLWGVESVVLHLVSSTFDMHQHVKTR
jgi:hypothetical protein